MIIDKILTDLNIEKTIKNKDLIKSMVNDKTIYMWDKIPTLMEKLKVFKGYITLSNSKNMFKIGMEHTASEEYQNEFVDIIKEWASKYKLEVEYCFEKNVFYII